MSKRRRRIEPFETEITHLGPKGVGIGTAPDGKPVHVRGAAPGGRVLVRPQGKRKGRWLGAPMATVRPGPDHVEPQCAVFGLCGGCVLQQLSVPAQRGLKHRFALEQVAAAKETPFAIPFRTHPARGSDAGFGYRNKVELSFGSARYMSEAEHAAGVPIDGRFLGMHAPGRFDRVVDSARCELVSDAANRLIAVTRERALAPDAPVPWNVREHTGFWRHLVIREGFRTGELLVALYTASPSSPEDDAAVERLAEACMATDLGGPRLVGLVWGINDGVADVARGVTRRTWGTPTLTERLGTSVFEISPTAFFQTSTDGAEQLYDTIGEALGGGSATLVDLYCGAGSIGLYLRDRYQAIVGIEEVEASVENARRNAIANGVTEARFVVAKVEDALGTLDDIAGERHLVVDPPRAGLHPRVARRLATAKADVLVYVACNPASLGRDAELLEEGGWRMTDLWTVDLFPQTGHVEVVGRFIRPGRA